MAGSSLLIPLLYGIGLSVYSMSAIHIPQAKEILMKLKKADCSALARDCLNAETAAEVRRYLQDFSARL